MNTKIIKFDINKNLYDTLIAKQGDTKSRFLLFNLLDGSIPFSLENRSVRVYAIKPDRTEVFNDLIITDAAKGYCILELTTQMLAVAGTVKLELMVMEGDKKLTSNIFYMDVKESINSEKAVVSTNEFGTLLTALASLNEYDNYKNEIKNARGGQVNLKTRLDNFDEQLDTKPNKDEVIKKGEVDLNDMTERTLQAIQGGEGTTFELLSIPRDNSVTPEKTNFMYRDSINLFNRESLENKYNSMVQSDGSIKTSSAWTYMVSHKIYCKAGEQIIWYLATNCSVHQYGESDVYLGKGVTNKTTPLTLVDGTVYIRIEFWNNLDYNTFSTTSDAIIINGATPPLSFIAYNVYRLNSELIENYLEENKEYIDDNIQKIEQTKINGEIEVTNYMLLVDIIKDKEYNANGILVNSSNRHSTTMTLLDKNKDMYCGAMYSSYAVFFDKKKQFISRTEFYSTKPLQKANFPENAKYVAFSYIHGVLLADKMYVSTINTSQRAFAYSSIIKYKGIRPQVYIYKNDSEEEIFLKMLDAWYTGDCDVHFEYGTYVFDNIYELMSTKYKWGDSNELIIGRNCRYYFNNATIISQYTGVNNRPHSNFGTHRWSDCGSYELYDGTLINYGGIYCVHDEASGGEMPYLRRYNNIKMIYITTQTTQNISKCIGGGTGCFGEVIIENSSFKSDNGDVDVSYHGNNTDIENKVFNLSIYNTFFDNNISLDWLGENEVGLFKFAGNYSKGVLNHDSKWQLTQWNNSIKND